MNNNPCNLVRITNSDLFVKVSAGDNYLVGDLVHIRDDIYAELLVSNLIKIKNAKVGSCLTLRRKNK
jgi:hypothetical protein